VAHTGRRLDDDVAVLLFEAASSPAGVPDEPYAPAGTARDSCLTTILSLPDPDLEAGGGASREEEVVARTSTRRRKGCGLCKPWKHAGHGDSYRQPAQVQRQFGSRRRWNRHDVASGK
jgi:hypothetical protein